MSSGAPRRVRPGLLVILSAVLLLAGCTEPEESPEKTLTQGFDILVSTVNGLYYPPFLRDETAGPEANSYAVRIRRLLDSEPPQLSVSDDTARFFRDEAVGASPLWGRQWLAPLAEAGVGGLLNDEDIAEIRRMQSADGYYAEAGAGADEGYRVAATVAALEVLAAADAVEDTDRRTAGAWLTRVAEGSGTLRITADAVRGLQILGLAVPSSAAPAVTAPADFGSLDDRARYEALLDAYSTAVIARAQHGTASLDPRVWGNVLQHNAGTLGFHDLYYLVVVAVAAGVPDADLAPVRARIARETLPDNSIRESDTLSGSPEATLFVLRLRGMAGEATTDAGQVEALKGALAAQPSAGPAERLPIAAARRLAGDSDSAEDLRTLCADHRAVPGAVTPDNAEWWSRATLSCAEAGIPVAPPHATAWPLDTPAGVTAAGTLVTGLADNGHSGEIPTWVTADSLRQWVADPGRLPSTSAYVTTVRAYLLLGGSADEKIRNSVTKVLTARQGCADLPGLYRADGSGSGCDLKATWAAWKLELQLDNRLPAPSTPSARQK
ncbi:hypothetical protein Aph02nite_90660 [Actinoplanes philippinensis]|nr:hypothetical protein Aph02nite_90660 [Actinoplanes philippinensis]